MRITGAACFHVSTLDRNSKLNTETLTLLASTYTREIKWVPWLELRKTRHKRTTPSIGLPSPMYPKRHHHAHSVAAPTPPVGERGSGHENTQWGTWPKARLGHLRVGWNTRQGVTTHTKPIQYTRTKDPADQHAGFPRCPRDAKRPSVSKCMERTMCHIPKHWCHGNSGGNGGTEAHMHPCDG